MTQRLHTLAHFRQFSHPSVQHKRATPFQPQKSVSSKQQKRPFNTKKSLLTKHIIATQKVTLFVLKGRFCVELTHFC